MFSLAVSHSTYLRPDDAPTHRPQRISRTRLTTHKHRATTAARGGSSGRTHKRPCRRTNADVSFPPAQTRMNGPSVLAHATSSLAGGPLAPSQQEVGLGDGMRLARETGDEEKAPMPEIVEDNLAGRGIRRWGTIMVVLAIAAVALVSSGFALALHRPGKDDAAGDVEQVIQASMGDEPTEETHDAKGLDPLLNRKQEKNTTFDDLPVYDGPVTNFIAVVDSTRAFNVRGDGAPKSTRSNGCKSSEGRVKFTLVTDLYAFETTWSISDRTGQVVASGPPPATNYARETRYIGYLCLEQGRYRLKINDMMGDGICCSYGQGKLSIEDDEGNALAETGDERFLEKNMQFRVVARSPQQPVQSNLDPPSLQGKAECSILNTVDYNEKVQVRTAATFPDYPCYRTVAGTNRTVDALVKQYPTLASKVVLNKYPTVERKLSLYSLVITNKQFRPNASFGNKGKLLSISSIHAQELSTAEAMLRFAEFLLQNYGEDPDLDWILDCEFRCSTCFKINLHS